MTDGEKAEAYFEKMKNEKIPFTITNVNNAIKQAYLDGMTEGRSSYNNLIKEHEKRVEKLKAKIKELKASIKQLNEEFGEEML